ncbi:MAG: DUF115 domain-containing protein [Flavobacteriales bacterium]|nr:DUF115 domain-containing protein [Flavobacteriales bacterium]
MSKSQKLYKSLADFLINGANTTVSVLKVLMLSKTVKSLPKPIGDRCLVLGNGPSLGDSLSKYPEYFHAHTIMCVNRFAVSPLYSTFKPSIYIILDPNFWTSTKPVITEALDAIRDHTSWPLDLIVPFGARNTDAIKDLEKNKFIRMHYTNYIVFRGFPSVAHFFYRRNRAMMQSRNVLVAAIFIAINLGYKRIEVFGADHSWHEQVHVTDDNILTVRMVHFYDNEEKIVHMPISKHLEGVEIHRIDETFDIWARVFHAYHQLKAYATSVGTKIYNASEKSYIDAFDRIKIK